MSKKIQTISFNNNQPKLHGQEYATLLAVFNDVPGELLHSKMPELIKYDTIRDDGKFYQLDPCGKYMILLFKGDLGILFSSIRKSNDENISKYNDSIGEVFYLDIKG